MVPNQNLATIRCLVHVAKSKTACRSVMDSWLKTGTLKQKSTINDNPSQETVEVQPNKTKPASIEKVFQRKWLDEFSWLVIGAKGAMICGKCRDTSLPSHSNKKHANVCFFIGRKFVFTP